MKTGLMMTFTTLAALTSLYIFSTSEVIDDIAIVLIFGLIADLMMTWIFNTGVLKWYVMRIAKAGDTDE